MIINDKNKEYNKEKNLRYLFIKNSNEKMIKIEMANGFFKRFRGLMMRSKCEYPLLFEIPQNIQIKERSSIHSLFMRFELTLVFIDDANLIYEIADLKPWKYYVPKKGAKYIIEFDKNEFENYDLKIGDEIELKYDKKMSGKIELK